MLFLFSKVLSSLKSGKIEFYYVTVGRNNFNINKKPYSKLLFMVICLLLFRASDMRNKIFGVLE